MLGLKKGDRGEAVKALQEMLRNAVFNPGPTDGVYGATTAAALLALRKSIASTATSGDGVDPWAGWQVRPGWELAPPERSPGSPGAALPRA